MFWYKLPQRIKGSDLTASLIDVFSKQGYVCTRIEIEAEKIGGSLGFEIGGKTKLQLVQEDRGLFGLKALYHMLTYGRSYFTTMPISPERDYNEVGFDVWIGPPDENMQVEKNTRRGNKAGRKLEEIIRNASWN